MDPGGATSRDAGSSGAGSSRAHISVVVVDDQEMVAEALMDALADEPDVEVLVWKGRRVDALVDAIRAAGAFRGAGAFRPGGSISRQAIGRDLTGREREVLGLLAEGRSTDEIVERLVLSPHTVRNHIRSVLAKLGAHSRLEAVSIAVRAGVVRFVPRPPERA